jgi:hypothetical protein
MIHFIGPKDNYDGHFGVEYNGQGSGWTVHVLPRCPFWGVTDEENSDIDFRTYGIGPFFTLVMAKYKEDDAN